MMKGQIINSSLWILLLNTVKRFLGIISLAILARFLTKDDFGLVAIVMIFIVFFERVGNSGSLHYILQKQNVDNDDLNTSWTLDLCLKSALWLALVMLAGSFADFYHREEIQTVIYVASISLIIKGLNNPGVHLLKRSFNYRSIFYAATVQKFTSFAVVVAAAIWFESYWALIIGDIVFSLVGLLMSYVISPFRPRLCLRNISGQWGFSKWVLIQRIFGFVKGQLDSILVSKIFSLVSLGGYNMAKNLAMMPSTEVINPSLEPLIKAFSSNRDNTSELNRKFKEVFCLFSVVVIPACFFLSCNSEEIIVLFLGEEWVDVHLLISVMSVFIFSSSFAYMISQILLAYGMTRQMFFLEVVDLIVTAAVLISISGVSILQFTEIRVGLSLGMLLIYVLWSAYRLKLNMLHALKILLPITASAFVAATVSGYILVGNVVLQLIASGVIFVALYAGSMLLLYGCVLRQFAEFRNTMAMATSLARKVSRRAV